MGTINVRLFDIDHSVREVWLLVIPLFSVLQSSVGLVGIHKYIEFHFNSQCIIIEGPSYRRPNKYLPEVTNSILS